MRNLRKNKLTRKFFAVLLCLTLFASTGVYAESIDDIKAQQAELQAGIDALNAQLEAQRNDEANKQAYKQTLEDSITLTQERIETARQNIETLNSSITALEEKLEKSEGEYADSMALLKKRIKAIYQTGDIGTVEILLNATSLYDFSLKTEMLKSFTEHDKKLLDEIEVFMQKTEGDRDSLNVQKEALAELKKQQEADQERLESLMVENNQAIAAVQAQQADTQSAISTKEQEDEVLNARLVELIEQERKAEEERKRLAEEARKNAENSVGGSSGAGSSVDTGTPIGGDGSGMSEGFSPRWPLPGYDTSWITCWYGEGGHNGLDIAGNYGASIVAAQSGKVISAEYHYSWGNNVFIYHNGTFSTRYAHMSSMAVSAGQYVERGQTIGYVGNTGYSFGNHLHFEVYYNGYRVDPYNYL